MKRYVIDGVPDIQQFFTDLYSRIQKPMLPEEDLLKIVDASGAPVFSGAEAVYYDDIILDCFVYCNDHHLDLHALAETAYCAYRLQRVTKGNDAPQPTREPVAGTPTYCCL